MNMDKLLKVVGYSGMALGLLSWGGHLSVTSKCRMDDDLPTRSIDYFKMVIQDSSDNLKRFLFDH